MRPLKTINPSGTYRKGVLLSALLVTTFLIFTVFAVTTNLNAANAGDNVEVVNTAGGADIFDIPASTQIVELSGCSFISPTYNPTKDKACATGHVRATELYNKINDINSSLNSINHRIDKLKETIEYIKTNGFSATNINKLSLYAIPAGDMSGVTPHITASNVSMKCLMTSPPSPLLGPSAVGKQVNYNNKDKVFNPLPIEALEALKKIMDASKQLQKTVDKMVADGKVGASDTLRLIKLISLSKKIEELTAEYLIPVVSLDSGTKNYSRMSISYKLDGFREKQTFEVPGWIASIADGFMTEVPRIVTEVTMQGEVGLNAVIGKIRYTDKIEPFSLKTSMVPEDIFFNNSNKAIDKHMKEYQKLKSELETDRNALQVEVDALVNNKFNCPE